MRVLFFCREPLLEPKMLVLPQTPSLNRLLRAAVFWIEFRIEERIITPRRIVGGHVITFLTSKHRDDDVFTHARALELESCDRT